MTIGIFCLFVALRYADLAFYANGMVAISAKFCDELFCFINRIQNFIF